MSRDDSDKDSVGFINGRPAKVELDGKITYIDEQDQIKVGGKKTNNKPRQTSLFVRRLRVIIGIVVLIAAVYFLIIPFFETGGGMADTREVPGDATHFARAVGHARRSGAQRSAPRRVDRARIRGASRQ